jgi:hypothetical protein
MSSDSTLTRRLFGSFLFSSRQHPFLRVGLLDESSPAWIHRHRECVQSSDLSAPHRPVRLRVRRLKNKRNTLCPRVGYDVCESGDAELAPSIAVVNFAKTKGREDDVHADVLVAILLRAESALRVVEMHASEVDEANEAVEVGHWVVVRESSCRNM